MIYFIAADQLDLVKIGYSMDPEKRMAAMQAHSPALLRMIGAVDMPPSFEGALHTFWIAHHSHREWFSLSPIAPLIAQGGA